MSKPITHPQPLGACFYIGRALVLSPLFYSSLENITSARSEAVKAFSAEYSALTQWVATFATIPFPELYNYSADLVLMWNWTKVLLILIQIWPDVGGGRAILQMVLFETVWSILAGNNCPCYFAYQLTIIAGLLYVSTIKKDSK